MTFARRDCGELGKMLFTLNRLFCEFKGRKNLKAQLTFPRNQISGQAKDAEATLNLNRPRGLVIQAAKHGHSFP